MAKFKFNLPDNLEEEIWKDVVGFENHYMVSNYGRVKSIKFNKTILLSNKKSKTNGYLRVNLYKNNRLVTKTIHRLVAEAFIPNPENKPQIDHLNTDKTDNRVENLRWATISENRNNPITKERCTGIKREGEALNNIRAARCRCVCQFDLDDNLIKIWNSVTEAQNSFGVFVGGHITQCCKGSRKTAYGYKWKYNQE